jgi:hypothetical protein
MDVSVGFGTYPHPFVDDSLGTLTGRSVIEIHDLLSINLSGKNREHISDICNSHFQKSKLYLEPANLTKTMFLLQDFIIILHLIQKTDRNDRIHQRKHH